MTPCDALYARQNSSECTAVSVPHMHARSFAYTVVAVLLLQVQDTQDTHGVGVVIRFFCKPPFWTISRCASQQRRRGATKQKKKEDPPF